MHNICEFDNINSINFFWISIISYMSETFWKGYWVKTWCRISLIYAVGKDDMGTREKRQVLLHS